MIGAAHRLPWKIGSRCAMAFVRCPRERQVQAPHALRFSTPLSKKVTPPRLPNAIFTKALRKSLFNNRN